MKKIIKNINEKVNSNIGMIFFVSVLCVLGIITSTLSRVNKQTGDVRGEFDYLTPTVPPTVAPTLTCSQQCTGIIDPTAYDRCMAACNGYTNLSPTSVIPTPKCGSACNYETQICSNGQCINKADRCHNDSMSCDSGCSSGSYQCCDSTGCHWYSGASCIPPSCPVSTCPAGKTCHGESYSQCCNACSNCIACVRLVVDAPAPTVFETCEQGVCPSTCHTNVIEITNLDCSKSICPSNCSTACSGDTCCPAAGFCTGACGGGGTVPNGSCGTINCDCTECGPHGSNTGCGNWTQTYDCKSAVTGCNECGPHRSGSSCGNWTETYDCSSSSTSGCTECGPHGSNTGCGNWTQTYDCKSAVTGCNECETCTLKCGQSKNCGGTCTSTDAGNPGGVTVVSPVGTLDNPAQISGPDVLLRWIASTNPLVDFYRVRVTDSTGATTYFLSDDFGPTDTSATVSGLNYGTVYRWIVRPFNKRCAAIGVSTSYPGDYQLNYFKLNRAPTFESFAIYGSNGTTEVLPQTGNRNQICQSSVFQLNGALTRNVTFRVSITDPDGVADIKKVSFRMRSGTTDYVTATLDNGVPSITGAGASFYGAGIQTSVSGNTRIVNFPIHFTEDFNTAIYNMEVYAQDFAGDELPVIWTDTARFFKVWNCKIRVRGTLYDGSDEVLGPSCSSSGGSGFNRSAGPTSNFTSLVFQGVFPAEDKTMLVNPPFYVSGDNGDNDLLFSMKYNPIFSNLAGTNPVFRIRDYGSGAVVYTCSGLPIFPQISMLDPYVDVPELEIDFSSVLDQESWFQTVGGGVNSKSVITDNVPVTCQYDTEVDLAKKCQPAVSRDTVFGTDKPDSGLIAGSGIKNTSGCENCKYGNQNDWGIERDVIGESYGYKYFYDRYYIGLKQGAYHNGSVNLKDIEQTGVIFVNGNLDITQNNARIVPGNFLMLIVEGNINIASTVTELDGIFIADGQIIVGQKSDSPLTINGVLYSPSSKISLTRSFETKEFNNTSPAVVVKYRPDFIFSMPGKLVKVLSGWKEGQ